MDKNLLKRLDETSRQYGRTDKQQQISNIAQKVLSLLEGRCGKLSDEEKRGFGEIGRSIVKIGEAYYLPGDPDGEGGMEEGKTAKPLPKQIRGGRGGEQGKRFDLAGFERC